MLDYLGNGTPNKYFLTLPHGGSGLHFVQTFQLIQHMLRKYQLEPCLFTSNTSLSILYSSHVHTSFSTNSCKNMDLVWRMSLNCSGLNIHIREFIIVFIEKPMAVTPSACNPNNQNFSYTLPMIFVEKIHPFLCIAISPSSFMETSKRAVN